MIFNIFGFYKFKKINNLKKIKLKLQDSLLKHNFRGSIIISQEGINGTISGKSNILKFKKEIKIILNITALDSENISKSKFQPFHKAKVKIKKEVVPMGIKVLSKYKVNNHIDPLEWNSLIAHKNTYVLDSRKPFEYRVGTFKKAINPNVNNFREFPKFLNKLNKKKSVAMFCTGGIRCEKASIYLEKKGFKNVFQLKGGILNYLKKIDKKDSLWKGECFVFDNRISVKHNLVVGTYSICSGCRKPISIKDKKSIKYEKGVSCPRCHSKLTNIQKTRFRMRQKQINLAKKAGKRHIFQKEY
tara:strand:- start:132 stop:1034 length:903 start_codon:yes stop_codon:yes gene_type:complete